VEVLVQILVGLVCFAIVVAGIIWQSLVYITFPNLVICDILSTNIKYRDKLTTMDCKSIV